jgi:cyclase
VLKKRVIFTLLYDAGRFMLSRNFRLQKVGDLTWLQKNYNFSKVAFAIDELVVLDVTRSERDTKRFSEVLKILTQGCFAPIAAGGGIRSVDQAKMLLRSGADKVVINTPLFENASLIDQLASEFGQQCLVASVDVKKTSADSYEIRTHNGTQVVPGVLTELLSMLDNKNVGEIYLNSMDRDGTGQGYDMGMLDNLPESISKPVILAGGAGNFHHLAEGLSDPRVDGVATAHLFNFVGDGLQNARVKLLESRIELRM